MRFTTAAEAVKLICPHSNVYIQGSTSIPEVLVRAMTDRAAELTDVTLYSGFAVGRADAPYCSPEYKDTFLVNSLFVANNIRRWLAQGYGQSIPAFLGEIPGCSATGRCPSTWQSSTSRPQRGGLLLVRRIGRPGRFGRGMRQDSHRAGQHGHAVLLRRRHDPPLARRRGRRGRRPAGRSALGDPHRHRTQDRQPHRRTDPRRGDVADRRGRDPPTPCWPRSRATNISGCIPRR